MSAPSLLEKLPVELIYEIQLSALSESVPVLNRRAHAIFTSSSTTYRAEYVFLRYATRISTQYTQGELVTHALKYPICSAGVLDALLCLSASESIAPDQGPLPLLPKRLFKPLGPRTSPTCYLNTDAPLPFVRYLYRSARIRPPDPNAHEGYALARAVHAGHRPLIRFLLKQGASPKLKDALAVRIAIKKRDVALVRGLIEREAEEEVGCEDEDADACENDAKGEAVEVSVGTKKKKSAKRRRVADRVEVTTAMLRLAVETDARDIVQYFLDRGARPDLSTIQRMRRIGFV